MKQQSGPGLKCWLFTLYGLKNFDQFMFLAAELCGKCMQIITTVRSNILCCPTSDLLDYWNSNLPAAWQYPLSPRLRFYGMFKLKFTRSVATSYGAASRILLNIETWISRQRGNIPWRRAPDLVDYWNSNLLAVWQYPIVPHPGFGVLFKLEFTGSVTISYGAASRIRCTIQTWIYRQRNNIIWRSILDLVDSIEFQR